MFIRLSTRGTQVSIQAGAFQMENEQMEDVGCSLIEEDICFRQTLPIDVLCLTMRFPLVIFGGSMRFACGFRVCLTHDEEMLASGLRAIR